MKVAKFLNLYLLLNGSVEAGNTFDTLEEALAKGEIHSPEIVSYITQMLIVENGIITAVAVARK